MAIEKHKRVLESQRVALQRFTGSGQDNEESVGHRDQQQGRETVTELNQMRYAVFSLIPFDLALS